MKKILALKGRANSGKTTTINLLPILLAANGYQAVPGSRKNQSGDFQEIFDNGSILLGVTSAGDTEDIVQKRLDDLVSANCDIIICACRTYGGTHTAINSYINYNISYIQKTIGITTATQTTANAQDANTLLALI